MSRFTREDLAGLLKIYLVTDPLMPLPRTVEDVAGEALAAGVRAVQLRDKTASRRLLAEQGVALGGLCRRYGALFLVNDDPLAALDSGADGVHLGQSDASVREARTMLGEGAVIGVSVRSADEAAAAEAAGADYLAANLVFATATKTDLPAPIGLEGVRMLRRASGLPLVAIGGIDAGNARSVIEAGADGIAVVSAVMAAPDVPAAVGRLLDSVQPPPPPKGSERSKSGTQAPGDSRQSCR